MLIGDLSVCDNMRKYEVAFSSMFLAVSLYTSVINRRQIFINFEKSYSCLFEKLQQHLMTNVALILKEHDAKSFDLG